MASDNRFPLSALFFPRARFLSMTELWVIGIFAPSSSKSDGGRLTTALETKRECISGIHQKMRD